MKRQKPVRRKKFARSLIEMHVHKMTNMERRLRHLRSIRRYKNADLAAYWHSRDMAMRGFFGHTNPDGLDPSDRGDKVGLGKAGYCVWENLASENTGRHRHSGSSKIFIHKDEKEIAKYLVLAWMRSKLHKRNILDGDHSRVGIGVFVAKNGVIFAALNYCKPASYGRPRYRS